MDNLKEISNWSVDLASPERLLLVEGNNLEEQRIVDILKTSGYKAEKLG